MLAVFSLLRIFFYFFSTQQCARAPGPTMIGQTKHTFATRTHEHTTKWVVAASGYPRLPVKHFAVRVPHSWRPSQTERNALDVVSVVCSALSFLFFTTECDHSLIKFTSFFCDLRSWLSSLLFWFRCAVVTNRLLSHNECLLQVLKIMYAWWSVEY